MSEDIPRRLQELLNEQVFEFALAAQDHYKTSDLVIVLDLNESKPELEAIPRQRLANSSEVPERVRLKLSKPASEARKVLGSPNQSFWFFVSHEGGDADCVAINASMLAPGGNA